MVRECRGMPEWLKRDNAFPVRSESHAKQDFATHGAGGTPWPLQAPVDDKNPDKGVKPVGFRYQDSSSEPWMESSAEHMAMNDEEVREMSRLAEGDPAKLHTAIEQLEKVHQQAIAQAHRNTGGGNMTPEAVFNSHIRRVQKTVKEYREKARKNWCQGNAKGGMSAYVKYAYGALFFLFFVFAASFAYDIATDATAQNNDPSQRASPFSVREFGLGVPLALMAFCLTICVMFLLKLSPGRGQAENQVFTNAWVRVFAYAVGLVALVGASFDYCKGSPVDKGGNKTDCAKGMMWTRSFTAFGFYAAAILTIHEVTMGVHRVPGALISPPATKQQSEGAAG